MDNFYFSLPTQVYFGKGQISRLGKAIKPYGSKVLLVYGGGSIKKSGLYDQTLEILKENQIEIFELAGVEPNPRIETVRKGVQICKENQIEVVLAVGGGSTIDCAKVICAGAVYDGDAWDLVTNPRLIKGALPLLTVLTLTATGSEMDLFSVISNMEENLKVGTASPYIYPKVSILDPEYTYSVSKIQTSSGVADIMSHVFESYFSNQKGAFLQSRFAEAILKTCIEYGPVAYSEPENYEARANLMWAASWAINGLITKGNNVEWVVHPMEHELSAFYDVTHGVGLAILTPRWMEYALNEETAWKFAEYGIHVWNIDSSLPAMEIGKKAIKATKDFYKSLELPSTLKEIGIGEEKLEVMAKKAAGTPFKNGMVPIDASAVLTIYKAAL